MIVNAAILFISSLFRCSRFRRIRPSAKREHGAPHLMVAIPPLAVASSRVENKNRNGPPLCQLSRVSAIECAATCWHRSYHPPGKTTLLARVRHTGQECQSRNNSSYQSELRCRRSAASQSSSLRVDMGASQFEYTSSARDK